MLSVDTNIIVFSLNRSMAQHVPARRLMEELASRDDVAIAEQVLVEVYLLVRNPAVFAQPYPAQEAVAACQAYRANPRWRLIDCEPVMDDVWRRAGSAAFARRRIIDTRLAFTLRAAGVTEFATHNVADFDGFGFDRVWDPLS
jgi:uncharacterized protein